MTTALFFVAQGLPTTEAGDMPALGDSPTDPPATLAPSTQTTTTTTTTTPSAEPNRKCKNNTWSILCVDGSHGFVAHVIAIFCHLGDICTQSKVIVAEKTLWKGLQSTTKTCQSQKDDVSFFYRQARRQVAALRPLRTLWSS